MLKPKDKFKLSQADKDSSTWRNLKGHVEKEIQRLREKNDSLNITERDAMQVRGMIAAYKALLSLQDH